MFKRKEPEQGEAPKPKKEVQADEQVGPLEVMLGWKDGHPALYLSDEHSSADAIYALKWLQGLGSFTNWSLGSYTPEPPDPAP